MNEKFWDMQKEKQDRIVNAAIRIFAEQGYDHASTDEIVKRADISKGLLFHYFISKQGLYQFLYSYFSRFMKLELSSVKKREHEGFFARCVAIEQAKGHAMKQYPYIQLFLTAAQEEDAARIGGDFADLREEYAQFCRELYIMKEECEAYIAEKYEDWIHVAEDIAKGAMKRNIHDGEMRVKVYLSEISRLFDMLGASFR